MVIAFMDPNCIFCHEFWEKVQPEIKAGKMQLKVVPVGFLKPSSFPKVVTIMQQKNPVVAWGANESNFNVPKEEGSTTPAKTLSVKYGNDVKSNNALLARTGEIATPTVLICNHGEKEPELLHGIPETGFGKMIQHAVPMNKSGLCLK